jgi:hypothetical protein
MMTEPGAESLKLRDGGPLTVEWYLFSFVFGKDCLCKFGVEAESLGVAFEFRFAIIRNDNNITRSAGLFRRKRLD